MSNRSYIIIMPVRNEAKFLAGTVGSIGAQTCLPTQLIIVDDGSSDETGKIAERAAAKHNWIQVVHRKDRGFHQPGGGVMDAFFDGFRLIKTPDWDFIVKLDGDLSFAPDYFERCLARFEKDPTLGIGGGTICNMVNGSLVVEDPGDPAFHVRGATKIYKRECWDGIGGLIRQPGWDSVDEYHANMLGYTTCTFPELMLAHHRPAGGAQGTWKTWVKNGLANYVAGYHPLFMFCKCAKRTLAKPYGVGALGLLTGFFEGYVKAVPQVNSSDLIRFVRTQQMRRLFMRESLWDQRLAGAVSEAQEIRMKSNQKNGMNEAQELRLKSNQEVIMNDNIERRTKLSPTEFAEDYLYPHKPVVITDALRGWRALSRWSPEFFKQEFGDMQFSIVDGKRGKVPFTMSSFIDRVLASDESDPAPYFRNQVFQDTFPTLKQDIDPLPEYFSPNWMGEKFWLKRVQRSLNRGGAMEIYIGGKGGAFPYLHYDGMATHAFLLQIYGQKRFILYGPEQEEYLYPGKERPNHTQIPDLDHPDLDKFPLFAKAKPISFILEPGEMLFIPYRWWHTTRMLSPSISLSVNILNGSNWAALTDWVATRNPVLGIPSRMYLDCSGAWRTAKDRHPHRPDERRGAGPSTSTGIPFKPGFGYRGLEKVAVTGLTLLSDVAQTLIESLGGLI